MAWLMAHGQRSRAWLVERLADGFDVHHIDGNHQNNAPQNLVLIEHWDHMMLHGIQARHTREEVRRRMSAGNMKKAPEVRSRLARKAAKARWKKSAAERRRRRKDPDLIAQRIQKSREYQRRYMARKRNKPSMGTF